MIASGLRTIAPPPFRTGYRTTFSSDPSIFVEPREPQAEQAQIREGAVDPDRRAHERRSVRKAERRRDVEPVRRIDLKRPPVQNEHLLPHPSRALEVEPARKRSRGDVEPGAVRPSQRDRPQRLVTHRERLAGDLVHDRVGNEVVDRPDEADTRAVVRERRLAQRETPARERAGAVRVVAVDEAVAVVVDPVETEALRRAGRARPGDAGQRAR
jgi:hypothetical protein